jgi:DNA-binding CsgD family transcriptional regulator
VHHAELLALSGAWPEALAEAGAVTEPVALAEAAYVKGELHRELGLYGAADAHFREASRLGHEPQPGLALLRMAQGNSPAASVMIRRCLRETDEPARRAGLLPAAVEILIRGGELSDAAEAAAELERLAELFGSSVLAASSEQAAGAVALARDQAEQALRLLRSALARWHALGAPYEAARTRMLIAQGCRLLDDNESADLERAAARDSFVRLGAAADLAHADSDSTKPALTPRELVVLRMLAAGVTNKVIATDLVLSERTVDRHVSNILAKLGVSSRTAAAAYAVQKELARDTQ